MLDIQLISASGFTDESFDTGRLFMRRDCEEVGNLTIHSKAFIRCHNGETVTAWQTVNVYITGSMRHLCEFNTISEGERDFASTEDALRALGFDIDLFRQLKNIPSATLKITASGTLSPFH